MDCAGVANGTAFMDACNICSGGTTGRTAITDANQCGLTTGTDDAAASDKIIISPNPFREQLMLTIPAGSKVEIIDLNGRLIYEGSSIENIQTGGFSAGLYIIRIITEKGVQTFRLEKI